MSVCSVDMVYPVLRYARTYDTIGALGTVKVFGKMVVFLSAVCQDLSVQILQHVVSNDSVLSLIDTAVSGNLLWDMEMKRYVEVDNSSSLAAWFAMWKMI